MVASKRLRSKGNRLRVLQIGPGKRVVDTFHWPCQIFLIFCKDINGWIGIKNIPSASFLGV